MPDYTVRVQLVRPAIVVGQRAQTWAVRVVDPHTYTVDTGIVGGGPAPTAPVNTVAPVVSGTITEGELLSCTEGTWTGTLPITYSYQWYRDDGFTLTPVGTDSPTYTLVAGDVGFNILCNVTASNVAGSQPQVSNTVGPIASAATPPVNTTAPVASGVIRIGELLSTTDGTWTGTPAPTYAYQWTRDGAPIGSATSATYTVVAADMACEIACEVTATNSAGVVMEPSNSLASPWRDILVARPGVLIWDGQDPYCYGGAAVGSPVSEIRTVDGVVIGTQALSGSRPTRTANGLSFDGTDDHLICDALASAIVAAAGYTIQVGFEGVNASTARQTIWGLAHTLANASGLIHFVQYNAPAAPLSTRMRSYYSYGPTLSVSLVTLTQPIDLSVAQTATSTRVVNAATGTLVQAATVGAPTQTPPWIYLTLGAMRYGSGPTTAYYWGGQIRHWALDYSTWSDADVAVYAACAVAAGVM